MLTSPILLAAAKAFTWEIPGDMTVDLGAVTFGDSALLNALIDIRLDQHELGHTMKTNTSHPAGKTRASGNAENDPPG